ncbi:MAG: molybdopterin converting factor subunit 1 [Saprospiraceae bacterium]
MKLTLLSFGIAKDITGQRFREWELPAGAKVSDLRAQLARQYPVLKELSALRIAVNSEYAAENVALNEGDEVALIPPVSGG